jgi:hypothetical protein
MYSWVSWSEKRIGSRLEHAKKGYPGAIEADQEQGLPIEDDNYEKRLNPPNTCTCLT